MLGGRKLRIALLTGGACLACVAGGPGVAHATTTTTFGFTGAEQAFRVPVGVTSMHVTALGAPGGRGAFTTNPGGLGGLAIADLVVTPGQLLYVEVGGPGGSGGTQGTPGAAGFNGGAVGGQRGTG